MIKVISIEFEEDEIVCVNEKLYSVAGFYIKDDIVLYDLIREGERIYAYGFQITKKLIINPQ